MPDIYCKALTLPGMKEKSLNNGPQFRVQYTVGELITLPGINQITQNVKLNENSDIFNILL